MVPTFDRVNQRYILLNFNPNECVNATVMIVNKGQTLLRMMKTLLKKMMTVELIPIKMSRSQMMMIFHLIFALIDIHFTLQSANSSQLWHFEGSQPVSAVCIIAEEATQSKTSFKCCQHLRIRFVQFVVLFFLL